MGSSHSAWLLDRRPYLQQGAQCKGAVHCKEEGTATRKVLQQGKHCNKEGVATRKCNQELARVEKLFAAGVALQQGRWHSSWMGCSEGGWVAAQNGLALQKWGSCKRKACCKRRCIATGRHTATRKALQQGSECSGQAGCRRESIAASASRRVGCKKERIAMGSALQGGAICFGKWHCKRELQWWGCCKKGCVVMGEHCSRRALQ